MNAFNEQSTNGDNFLIDSPGSQCIIGGVVWILLSILVGMVVNMAGLPMAIFYGAAGVGFVLWIAYVVQCLRS